MNTEPNEHMNIVWHQTPESVFHAKWELDSHDEDAQDDEIPSVTEIKAIYPDGYDEPETVEQVVESIRAMSVCGFVDIDKRTIHAWASEAATPAEVLYMLAHQVGSVTGDPEDDGDEDIRAETFGLVAVEAHWLLSNRPKACGLCHTCRTATLADPGSIRMVLCPMCGNKRCPRANSCANACTGSNDPGQPGSAY